MVRYASMGSDIAGPTSPTYNPHLTDATVDRGLLLRKKRLAQDNYSQNLVITSNSPTARNTSGIGPSRVTYTPASSSSSTAKSSSSSSSSSGGGSSKSTAPAPIINPVTGNPYANLGATNFKPQGQASSGSVGATGITNLQPNYFLQRAADIAAAKGYAAPSGYKTSTPTVTTPTTVSDKQVSNLVEQNTPNVPTGALATSTSSLYTPLTQLPPSITSKVLQVTKTPISDTSQAVSDFFRTGGVSGLPGVATPTGVSYGASMASIKAFGGVPSTDISGPQKTSLSFQMPNVIPAAIQPYTFPKTLPGEVLTQVRAVQQTQLPNITVLPKIEVSARPVGPSIKESLTSGLGQFYKDTDYELKRKYDTQQWAQQQAIKSQKDLDIATKAQTETINSFNAKVAEADKYKTNILDKALQNLEERKTNLESQADKLPTEQYVTQQARLNKDIENYKTLANQYNKVQSTVLSESGKLPQTVQMWEDKKQNALKDLVTTQDIANKKLEDIKNEDILYRIEKAGSRDIKLGISDIKSSTSLLQTIGGTGEFVGGVGESVLSGMGSVLRGTSDVLIGQPIRNIQSEGIQENPLSKSLPPVARFLARPIFAPTEFGTKYLEGVGRGIYNWKAPIVTAPEGATGFDKFMAEQQLRIHPEGILGAANIASFGLGALAGATSGVTLPTITTTGSRVLSTLGTIGKGVLIAAPIAVTLGAPAYAQSQYSKQINNVQEQLNKLETQKDVLPVGEYKLAKQYYQTQLTQLQKDRPSYIGQVAKSVGELGTISAGGYAGAQLFKQPITSEISVVQKTERAQLERLQGGTGKYKPQYSPESQLQFEQTVGGKLGAGYRTAPGQEPFSVPEKTSTVYSFQERPQGIKGLITGNKIDTTITINPSGTLTRTRLFNNAKYITTQTPGSSEAITKIFEGSKLLGSVKEPLIDIQQLTALIPKNIDIGPTKILKQQVGTEKQPAELIGQRTTTQEFDINKIMGGVRVKGGGTVETTTTQGTTVGPKSITTISKSASSFGQPEELTGFQQELKPYELTYDANIRKIIPGLKSKPLSVSGDTFPAPGRFETVTGEPYTRITRYSLTPAAQTTQQVTSIASGSYQITKPTFLEQAGLAAEDIAKSTSNALNTIGRATSFAIRAPAYAMAGTLAVPNTAALTGVKGITQFGVNAPTSVGSLSNALYGPVSGFGNLAYGGVGLASLYGVGTSNLINTSSLTGLRSISLAQVTPLLESAPISETFTPSVIKSTTIPSIDVGTRLQSALAPASISAGPSIGPTLPPGLIGGLGLAGLGGLKIPTFGAIPGGLFPGQGTGSRRGRGSYSWLVTNPIANYAGEWFARQEGKTIGGLTGVTGSKYIASLVKKSASTSLRGKI